MAETTDPQFLPIKECHHVNPQTSTLSAAISATGSPVDIQEQVRRRAFELYEQHGKEDGHDLDDWLQAESELAPQYYAGLEILAYVENPKSPQ